MLCTLRSSPRCAASTVCRRLCAPFCLMSSCLPPVSSPRPMSRAGSFLTWSGALGRCGPAPTTARSAAPLCLLHLGRAAEREGSCGPSIGRKTQCWYWYVLDVWTSSRCLKVAHQRPGYRPRSQCGSSRSPSSPCGSTCDDDGAPHSHYLQSMLEAVGTSKEDRTPLLFYRETPQQV